MNKLTSPKTHPSSMPSRRERLQMFLKLKSQRQLLIIGATALAAISLILAAALVQDLTDPTVVKLGEGVASVDARPVSDFAPQALAEPRDLKPTPLESPIGTGDASFYGNELAGNLTASGEVFNPKQLTAAHRTLPLGSQVRVTNARNGESVVVRINDRGPYHANRVIDLSTAAARTIGLIHAGTGRVSLALLVH